MSATYSINVGTIYESSKLDSINSVLLSLPDNNNKLISPKDVRSAIYTTWENITFKPTTISSSTVEYIGIDQSTFKEKIFFGKKQLGTASVMNDTLLNSDVDIFIYNTKSDSNLSQQDTKIAILAGTDSSKYSYSPYLSSLKVIGSTNSRIDFTVRNPDLNGGNLNITSDYGYVYINGLKFPSLAYTVASASNGYTLVYRGGTMSWEPGGVGGGGSGDISGLSNSIVSLSQSVDSLSSSVSSNLDRIISLSQSVIFLSQSLSTLNASASSIRATISGITSSIFSFSQSIILSTQYIANLSASASNIYTSMSNISSGINSITNSISSITGSIYSFSASINSLSASVASYANTNAFMYVTYSWPASLIQQITFSLVTISTVNSFSMSTNGLSFSVNSPGTYKVGVSTYLQNYGGTVLTATVSSTIYTPVTSVSIFPFGSTMTSVTRTQMASSASVYYDTVVVVPPTASNIPISLSISLTNNSSLSNLRLAGFVYANRLF